jgi:hypothetical protein
MNKMNEIEFLDAIRRQLDQSIAQLDPPTALRLDAMRARVLNPSKQETKDSLEFHDQRNADDLLHAIQTKLDHDTSLPPEIEARLDGIRQRAVAKLDSQQNQSQGTALSRLLKQAGIVLNAFTLPIPAASLVATACVMVTVVALFYVASGPSVSLSFEEEISLIASADDIELYENLEFYLWLAETELAN